MVEYLVDTRKKIIQQQSHEFFKLYDTPPVLFFFSFCFQILVDFGQSNNKRRISCICNDA